MNNTDTNTKISRRVFLGGAFSRLLNMAPLAMLSAMSWQFLLMPFKIKLEQKIVAGSLDDLPQGVKVMRTEGIALVREGDQLKALSLSCTHLGCTVNRTSDGFVCPCHGSRFDAGGRVLNGPAARDLDQFPVEVSADRRVIVDLGLSKNIGRG